MSWATEEQGAATGRDTQKLKYDHKRIVSVEKQLKMGNFIQ